MAGVQAATDLRWLLFPLGWIIASGYLIWFARRLKVVSIDDDFVYVLQSGGEIRIPLSQIQDVKENFLARPKLITLTLNQPSEFGTEIVFVPPPMAFAPLRSHPLVEEIERAIRRRRSGF